MSGTTVFELRYFDCRDFYTHYDDLLGYYSTFSMAQAAAKTAPPLFGHPREGPINVKDVDAGFTITEMQLQVDGLPIRWHHET